MVSSYVSWECKIIYKFWRAILAFAYWNLKFSSSKSTSRSLSYQKEKSQVQNINVKRPFPTALFVMWKAKWPHIFFFQWASVKKKKKKSWCKYTKDAVEPLQRHREISVYRHGWMARIPHEDTEQYKRSHFCIILVEFKYIQRNVYIHIRLLKDIILGTLTFFFLT